MDKSKTKMTFTAMSICNKDDVDQNCLLKDFKHLTLTKQDKEAQLSELKRTLEKLYAYMTLNGTPEKIEEPRVIQHLETLLAGRFCLLYLENKEQFLDRYRTPFKSLTGFVNFQVLLIEINRILEDINAMPPSEDPPKSEESPKSQETTARQDLFPPNSKDTSNLEESKGTDKLT